MKNVQKECPTLKNCKDVTGYGFRLGATHELAVNDSVGLVALILRGGWKRHGDSTCWEYILYEILLLYYGGQCLAGFSNVKRVIKPASFDIRDGYGPGGEKRPKSGNFVQNFSRMYPRAFRSSLSSSCSLISSCTSRSSPSGTSVLFTLRLPCPSHSH